MASFEDTFQKHRQILNDHLNLWKAIHEDRYADDHTESIAWQCIKDTNTMIEACAQLQDVITKQHQSQSTKQTKQMKRAASPGPYSEPRGPPVPMSKKRKLDAERRSDVERPNTTQIPLVVDESGLFMIDSNPTTPPHTDDDARVTGTASGNKKRRRSHHEAIHQTEQTAVLGLEAQDPPNKRMNIRDIDRPMSGINLNATVAQGVQFVKGNADDGSGDNAGYQPFENKVALRLKEKEEQRQRKVNKKRKRGSESSVVDINPSEKDVLQGGSEPQIGTRSELTAAVKKSGRTRESKKARN